MRVLVIGGTGVLGLPVVRALVKAGHQVTAASRTGGRVAVNAASCVVDLLDPGSLEEGLRSSEPEVVVHAATALPAGGPRTWSQLARTNALRDKGTKTLVSAAARHHVRRIVTQSFLAGYSPLKPGRERLTESDDFGTPIGSRGQREAATSLAAAERYTLSGSVEGTVLRFGFFYGDRQDRAGIVQAVKRRRLPLPGGARGCVSFTHVEDAAAAIRKAVESAADGTVYNAADDEPVSFGDYVRSVAQVADARAPLNVPVAMARLIAPAAVPFICSDRPLTSAAICQDLGWAPQHDVLSWVATFASANT